MTTLIKPHLQRPITSITELSDYLAAAARPHPQWGIGAEVEKLVVDAESGEAAPYARIETLLQSLEGSGQWQGVREEGSLIALLGPRSSITLEPGGQLELSGRLCTDLHCVHGDFAEHVAQIVAAAAPLGLRFLGLGVQPFTPPERIAWVPKSRYGVMGPYMLRTGDMGQRMMKQTAGLQVNIDFSDEADWLEKMRLSLELAPLLYSLFANSPLLDGAPSGFLSTRGEIWARTDGQRTGLLPELFAPGAGFSTYVEYALDIPMYFIVRDGQFIDLTGQPFPFRRYLAEGFADQRATMADWDLHLSTLFPEVRLRPQIEVRCADSLPPRYTMAMAALIKGIMYDEEARCETRRVLGTPTAAARLDLYRQSWRLGLQSRVDGRTLREVAVEVLDIARQGLRRQRLPDGHGYDETCYLQEIGEIAASGITLAERLLADWRGSREQKVAALWQHCGYQKDGYG
jgi:glutamate--cysteine ligase